MTTIQARIIQRGIAMYDGCKHEIVDAAHDGLLLRDPFDESDVFFAPWADVSMPPSGKGTP